MTSTADPNPSAARRVRFATFELDLETAVLLCRGSRVDRRCPRRLNVKLEIERPETKKSKKNARTVGLPRTVRLGGLGWSQTASAEKLTRCELYDRVWTTPAETLAGRWNLSGRGLAKACARLKIPVPPRGYWARVNAGQRVRKPKLRTLPSGQGEEILMRLREGAEDE